MGNSLIKMPQLNQTDGKNKEVKLGFGMNLNFTCAVATALTAH